MKTIGGRAVVQIDVDDRFFRALVEIRNVLGPDSFGCNRDDMCEGCMAEGAEALRIANEALGFTNELREERCDLAHDPVRGLALPARMVAAEDDGGTEGRYVTDPLKPACTCGGRCHERAEKWEDDIRAALIIRERLDRAEEFIEHMDMTYRWAEWLEEEPEE